MKLAYPADRPKLKPALRAVLAARAQMACDEVAAHGAGASLFALRKRTKECRGLLRLLRGGWDDATLWNARLRDAAATLAPARDAEIMLATFDTLTARRRAPSEFVSLRDMLLDELDIADAATNPDAIAQFAATMADFAHAVQVARIRGKAAALVWRNVGRTWAQGKAALARAEQAGEDANAFHDWRKRVKQHWYQARFFKPANRTALRAHIRQVDQLGKTLGHHNDLDVLHRVLQANCAGDPALARLERDLLSQRLSLAEKALTMGRPLYATADPAQDWPGAWANWVRAGACPGKGTV